MQVLLHPSSHVFIFVFAFLRHAKIQNSTFSVDLHYLSFQLNRSLKIQLVSADYSVPYETLIFDDEL